MENLKNFFKKPLIKEQVSKSNQESAHEHRPEFKLESTNALGAKPEDLEHIYEWYSQAMSRRDREPLSYDRFISHFFENKSLEPTFAYGNMEKGFLLGIKKGAVFIPTHFAPKTLRGGYELLASLSQNKDIPVIMAITEDLAETISKMEGWKRLDTKILAPFNDSLVSKDIVYNQYSGVLKIGASLLKDGVFGTQEKRRSGAGRPRGSSLTK